MQAAEAALPAWTALGPGGRSRVLYALARTLQRHSRLLAVLETLDNGKAIRESRDIDIPLAIRHFYHHAGWALRWPTSSRSIAPIGVVGQIVPWNFPLLMLAWKIAPALACGNTVVFKPAEQTSLTALLFAELCARPACRRVSSTSSPATAPSARPSTRHPGIRKIAFTGSTEVGREIRKATAGSGKKLSLELGGKSPFIVFADADLDAAGRRHRRQHLVQPGPGLLRRLALAGARGHGRTRCSPSCACAWRTLRVGDPLDKSIDMGPLIDRTQWQRVSGYVERARAEGAVITQAEVGALAAGDGNCYYPPTLVTGVETASEIVSDEVFGPVLVVQTFRTPAEAVELANHTRYGLAASLWSESIGLALDVAPRAQGRRGLGQHRQRRSMRPAASAASRNRASAARAGARACVEYLECRPPPPARRRRERACWPPRRRRARPMPSTAPPSSTSAASRCAPTAATAAQRRAGAPAAGPGARGQPQGHPQRRRSARARPAAGSASRRTAARRCCTTWPRTCRPSAARFVASLTPFAGDARRAAEVQCSVDRLLAFAAWADKFDGARAPAAGATAW